MRATVLQGTTFLPHGHIPSAAGFDAGTPAGARMHPWIKSGQRIVMEKGEGCVQYDFMNPAKGWLVERSPGSRGGSVSDVRA